MSQLLAAMRQEELQSANSKFVSKSFSGDV
jgi:hypothetical protein